MPIETLHAWVVWTARGSAVLFTLALAAPVLGLPALRLWGGFIVAHTVHFGFVAWYAFANSGRGLFPGGVSLEDAGGWPIVFASGSFFYVLAGVGFLQRRAGLGASRLLRLASALATSMLTFMFVAAYWPHARDSALYAIPIVALPLALGAYLASLARSLAVTP